MGLLRGRRVHPCKFRKRGLGPRNSYIEIMVYKFSGVIVICRSVPSCTIDFEINVLHIQGIGTCFVYNQYLTVQSI